MKTNFERSFFACKNCLIGALLESIWFLKFGYSEKATKFEKIFHLKFDATQ